MQSPVPLQPEWRAVRGQAGKPVDANAPGNTPIYGSGGTPIKTPDGRHLTAAEFGRARGGISTKCVDGVTYAVLQLAGLVPDGKYSVQLALVSAKPGEPPVISAPSDDPNTSVFLADGDGEADVAVAKSASPGHVAWAIRGCSGTQPAPVKPDNCWLADDLPKVLQFPVASLAGIYHPPGSGEGVPQFSFTFVRMIRVYDEVRDRGGNPISEATPLDEPLYEFRKQNPVMAPGGMRQITLGEFKQVAGSIAVKCTKSGTRVAMHLTGLIPHGVYSVWIAKPDPRDPSKPPAEFGALGSFDGSSGSSFTADGNGEAYIAGTNAPGKLSGGGTIANCWLRDEPMVQVAGVYHIDGTVHGPTAGPDGTYAGQFAFLFVRQ